MNLYQNMYKVSKKLLSQFGTECTLFHLENDKVVEYKGIGAKFRYESEAIGMSGNLIGLGDAKVICQFAVTPVETVDIVKIGNDNFNIITVGETSPDNATKIIYTLQVRRKN